VRPFATGAELLDALAELQPCIIVMSLRGSEPENLHVLANLRNRGFEWPVIALAENVTVSVAVAAMKQGALDVVEKPFETSLTDELLESVRQALLVSLAAAERVRRPLALIESLSPIELKVLRGLLGGHTNKSVAEICNLSVRTVEMHRARLLERLGVETLVKAVRIALEAGVEPMEGPAD
jgi:two-component system response regulator FixJ